MKPVTTMFSKSKKFRLLIAATILSFGTNTFADCFTELSDVASLSNVDNISSRWVQTDSSDNMPVTINLRETGDGLFVSFVKDGDILTEGLVQVCQDNRQLVLRPIGRLTPGRNAPAQLRNAMSNSGTRIRFTIANEDRMNVRISVPVFLGIPTTVPMTFASH